MINENLTRRLKRVVYSLGAVDMIGMLALAILVVGTSDVMSTAFRSKIESNDFVFYFLTYLLIICGGLFIISVFYCIRNTEIEMKKLGIAVIK